MKNLKLFVLLFVCLAIAGCSGARHCLKVGGEYKGIDGEFEYCLDFPKSEKAGVPVLSDPGGENLLFGLGKDLISKIYNKIAGKPAPAAGPVVASGMPRPPVVVSEPRKITPIEQIGKIIEIVNVGAGAGK